MVTITVTFSKQRRQRCIGRFSLQNIWVRPQIMLDIYCQRRGVSADSQLKWANGATNSDLSLRISGIHCLTCIM